MFPVPYQKFPGIRLVNAEEVPVHDADVKKVGGKKKIEEEQQGQYDQGAKDLASRQSVEPFSRHPMPPRWRWF
jgi:hypothetical protein